MSTFGDSMINHNFIYQTWTESMYLNGIEPVSVLVVDTHILIDILNNNKYGTWNGFEENYYEE